MAVVHEVTPREKLRAPPTAPRLCMAWWALYRSCADRWTADDGLVPPPPLSAPLPPIAVIDEQRSRAAARPRRYPHFLSKGSMRAERRK